MAFELQQLRQVLALAEHGSFVRAATVLHISQPALSRSIQNLERHLGTALFDRSAAGAVPTERGQLYIERARDLLRMADDLDRSVRGDAALQTGRVGVGGGPYPAESFLGPAAVRFSDLYPRVSVALRTRDWHELEQELRSRELDFFIGEVSTLQQQKDLEVQAMPSRHALYFIARADHPLAKRRDFRTQDIFAWPFIAPARVPPRILEPMLGQQRVAAAQQSGIRPFPLIQCNGLAPVRSILHDSDALSASILSCIARELAAGEYVILGTEPWLHLDYGVVRIKGRPLTHHAQAFLDLVFDAERKAADEERQLVARYGRRLRRRPRQ